MFLATICFGPIEGQGIIGLKKHHTFLLFSIIYVGFQNYTNKESSSQSQNNNKPVPDQVMKKRRVAANARERKRMDMLNKGLTLDYFLN